jgi:cytochrome c oxidase cbb3-type subunit I/II
MAEKLRYGEPSQGNEFIYDHPFLWGSKRTGPDLHRVGPKYPALWHLQHLTNPTTTSPGSNMPTYAFLADQKVDMDALRGDVAAMRTLHVPYAAELDVATTANGQAKAIADELAVAGAKVAPDSEMVALIAYLKSLSAR